MIISLRSLFLTCALAVSYGSAQAASLYVGYCDGGMSATGYSKTGSGTISTAIIYPADGITRYSDVSVTAIRIGLVTTDGVSNVKGWVRAALDGDNLAEAALSSPAEGWNEIAFDEPLTVDALDSIVIGYSFEQEKSVQCMSLAGEDNANGYWVAKDGNWQNRSSSYEGSLSVELVIEGASIPSTDLEITALQVDRPQVPYGDSVAVTCTVRNSAMNAFAGVSYTFTIKDITFAMQSDKEFAYRDTETLTFSFCSADLPDAIGMPLVAVAAIEGDDDETNNTAQVYVSTYSESYTRKVLLEEFTSEYCVNCPRAIETIATMMEEGYDTLTVCVAHHAGYTDDWLTTEHSEGLEWFYGDDGTYAPAGMFDRTQDDAYDSDVPVFSIGYAGTYRPMLQTALSFPSFVSVTPSARYDAATRELSIGVTLRKLPIFDYVCDAPRINIYIVEDSILAHDQYGYTSTTFRHRHVFRESLTGQWGERFEWDSDTFSADYSVVLSDDYDAQYVQVAAFVSHYNADDRNDCKVYASEGVEIKDQVVASVRGIYADECDAVSSTYYTTSGMRVDAPSQRGVYVQRTVGSDGTTTVRKVLF